MIAFPDYSCSASENTGANGFRETSLYYSEKLNSNDEKKNVPQNIAHELSHYVNYNPLIQKKKLQIQLNIF